MVEIPMTNILDLYFIDILILNIFSLIYQSIKQSVIKYMNYKINLKL